MNRLILGRSSVVLSIIGLLTIPVSFAQEPSAENELANPGFEEIDVNDPSLVVGWASFGGSTRIGAPSGSAQEGNYALELMQINPGWGIGFVRQLFDVVPGEEVYASAYMYIEGSPPSIPYFEALLKIAFFEDDTFSIDITPASISKGRDNQGQDPFYFPGIEGLPMIVSGSSAGTWHLTQSQGVVPEGATLASVGVFNINFTGIPAPIWFDNVVFARLEPDDDSDRIANEIDTDPLTPSFDFSDGTTNGTILSDEDAILSIDDATESNGIFVESAAAARGTFARISVCDSLASIRVIPNSAFDVTCGSVILDVADGSEPVELAVVISGETSYVTIPAGNDVTFDDENESILVEPESNSAEAVTLRVGSDTAEPVVIVPGVALSFGYELDVKPGSNENCFNIDGNGVVPVAILGGASANVADINNETISFNGLAVRQKGNGNRSCGAEDVNGDLVSDLVCHFEDDPSNWSTINDNGEGELTATLFNGTQISLSDYFCVMP